MIKKILYTIWIIMLAIALHMGLVNGSYSALVHSLENRAFDVMQGVIANSGKKHPSKDIVIIAIDDASYEYILDNYGEWPLRRDIYAKLVDFIETQHPKSIAFDLMFVKSMKSSKDADDALTNVFKKYNNVFTAMNLDTQDADLRIPAVLPNELKVNVENKSKYVDLDTFEYTNCRTIIESILNSTSNIGMINVNRASDGVLRRMPLFLKYRNSYYPQLAVKVALDYLGFKHLKHFVIDEDSNLILPDGREISLDEEGSVILNWYGGVGTYENIPLYKILKSMEKNEKFSYDFKDKVVYVGATASSLFDIKTVPVDRVYPGVEVQATYVNNIIDGNAIKQALNLQENIITLLIVVLTSWTVFSFVSLPLALVTCLSIYCGYVLITYFAMLYDNYWLPIVLPLVFGVLAFMISVIIKYLMKSKDFDEQYKLATTDGLTELFNHRYFQDQMKVECAQSARYGTPFSLIILDIDFFKKFNDNFGHQSGDAVLRQVSTILKKNVRSSDIVCRYGGEEISIILPNAKYQEGIGIAEKLCKIISDEEFHISNNRKAHVTVSIGVATYGYVDGIEPADIISSADKRLYEAKNNGRNRVN